MLPGAIRVHLFAHSLPVRVHELPRVLRSVQ